MLQLHPDDDVAVVLREQDGVPRGQNLAFDTAHRAPVGRRSYDEILDVASGRSTASERLGFGDEEFAPWRVGVVL